MMSAPQPLHDPTPPLSRRATVKSFEAVTDVEERETLIPPAFDRSPASSTRVSVACPGTGRPSPDVVACHLELVDEAMRSPETLAAAVVEATGELVVATTLAELDLPALAAEMAALMAARHTVRATLGARAIYRHLVVVGHRERHLMRDLQEEGRFLLVVAHR